jgi:RNA polymerase sigma factor (sigma-70 family)
MAMNSDLINRLWAQRTQWLARLKAIARDNADAEDLLQDIFCELVLANRCAEQIENIAGWVLRVARNRVIDAARKRQRQAAIAVDDDPPSDFSDDPERAYANSKTDARIRAALMQLPESQRAVFIAHELQGEPFASIAARTGESQNTLLARKFYAVRRLRALLGPAYFDHFREDETS